MEILMQPLLEFLEEPDKIDFEDDIALLITSAIKNT